MPVEFVADTAEQWNQFAEGLLHYREQLRLLTLRLDTAHIHCLGAERKPLQLLRRKQPPPPSRSKRPTKKSPSDAFAPRRQKGEPPVLRLQQEMSFLTRL